MVENDGSIRNGFIMLKPKKLLFVKAEYKMAALCNRAGHYTGIFALWFLSIFLSIFLSSPNLSAHRLDVYRTSTHGVALVRI